MVRMWNGTRSHRKTRTEQNAGFTLVELLVVIVVLGILASVVVFSLAGVTGQSVVSACQADVKSVQVAISAFQSYNPSLKGSVTSTDITGQSNSGPFLQSWPSNGTHYTVSVTAAGTVQLATNGQTAVTTYVPGTGTGAGSCGSAS